MNNKNENEKKRKTNIDLAVLPSHNNTLYIRDAYAAVSITDIPCTGSDIK